MTDEKLSYEQARTELAGVVERLEAGGSSLEESLALWERGEKLADVCQRWLDGARERIEAARAARDRRPTSRARRGSSSRFFASVLPTTMIVRPGSVRTRALSPGRAS